jgi:hypothetical protein
VLGTRERAQRVKRVRAPAQALWPHRPQRMALLTGKVRVQPREGTPFVHNTRPRHKCLHRRHLPGEGTLAQPFGMGNEILVSGLQVVQIPGPQGRWLGRW